jgi:uncharacterized membrane-anchored protein YjiN (DUF445 family)
MSEMNHLDHSPVTTQQYRPNSEMLRAQIERWHHFGEEMAGDESVRSRMEYQFTHIMAIERISERSS